MRYVGARREDALERGPVWRVRSTDTGGMPEIRVTGHPDFVQRRVTDWLKTKARDELNEQALFYADLFDVRPSRITVRDTTTRWGSCSPTRALSFSWRLILAPSYVLDYVAAHEVAHIRHMNHWAAFLEPRRRRDPELRDGQALAGGERPGPSPLRRRSARHFRGTMKLSPGTALFTVFLGALTAVGPLSTDMYLPSLPAIALAFAADTGATQLTLSAHLVGFAGSQLFYGPMSDRYGRRPVLLAGFTLCIVAASPRSLSVRSRS